MEPDGRNPFHSQQRTGTTSASPTNGILPGQTHEGVASPTGNPMVYAQAVAGRAPSPTTAGTAETMKRKRGRPRKYGTTSSGDVSAGAKQRKVKALVNVKKNQLVGVGIAGQGFTPHIINIAVGEDVAQKIMLFMQQSKREICILSASGLISSPSLRQPATTGGNITYEILTLSGFYMRTDLGGTGGLSVCLSSMDNQGQIIGGGVAGPLRAAGPVQVIVGSFLLDNKKEYGAGIRGDSRLASPISSAPVSVGFRSPVESSGRMQALGEDENQNIVGSHFMVQSHGMNLMQARPTDWRVGNDVRSGSTYELAGRTSHGAEESPENGNYDQI
ncbi:PPC domain [Dillenia turbinata]|uniref:AT-hook motif nuclear-localized protein n=1 Tax=Dillenia turbinata TaxID=194707 RepID=A0AAN8UH22_9MAGN